MLDNQLSYKEICEFVNLHGAACAYPTVVAFTKRYVGVVDPPRKKIDALSSGSGPVGTDCKNYPVSALEDSIEAASPTPPNLGLREAISNARQYDIAQKLAYSRETANRLAGKSARDLIQQAEKL